MSRKAQTEYIYDGNAMLMHPYQVLTQLREEGDVLWSPSMRRWLILSKSAAEDALRDTSLEVYDVFRDFDHVARLSGHALDELISVSSWIPFLRKGGRHKQLRGLFARVMQNIMEPYLTSYREASEELLNKLRERGEGDFAKEYADRVHIEALGRLCGLSGPDRATLAGLASSEGVVDFAVRVETMVDANERVKALLDLLSDITAKTKNNATLRLIGAHLESAGMDDTPQARIEFLVALSMLGRDTLAGTLTLGLSHMLDALGGRIEPEDWPNPNEIVSEFLRISSAVQIVSRVATKPVQLSGQEIAKGEILMIYLPSANRDPLEYPDHDKMNPSHGENIAFGAGGHLCVGRKMTHRALEISLEHFADLHIASLPARSIASVKNTRKFEILKIKVG